MNRRFLSFASVVACAAPFLFLSSARAASVTSGDVLDGWKVTFPPGIGLTQVDSNSGGPVLELSKAAVFSSLEGLAITFVQTSAAASPTVSIVSESVTNFSGSDWSGFQFLLASPLAPELTAASFTGSFSNIGSFTTSNVASNNVQLGGADIANGLAVDFGGAGGGALTISADPTDGGLPQVFVLKELPVGGGGSGPMVPLPAAVWSGLSGLGFLAVLAAFNKRRARRTV
jgi:hypothetical protein